MGPVGFLQRWQIAPGNKIYMKSLDVERYEIIVRKLNEKLQLERKSKIHGNVFYLNSSTSSINMQLDGFYLNKYSFDPNHFHAVYMSVYVVWK